MIIELVYITRYYTCGCVTCLPVQPPRRHREVYPQHPCKVCAEKAEREQERRAALLAEKASSAVRYMVDDHPMAIYKSGMYWHGRRYEHGKAITTSFGKVDPRPMLEEEPPA